MKIRILPWQVFLVGLVVANPACSDNAPGGVDAGNDGDAGPGTEDAAAVRPPVFEDWPCPAGWQAKEIGAEYGLDHDICLPPEQLDCPLGTAQFLGEDGCRPVGTECPTGEYHSEEKIRELAPGFDGKISYVRPGATGAGSREAPWGNIADAQLKAAPGAIVVLGEGSFHEEVFVYKRIALVGSCVDKTIITAPAPSPHSFSVVTIRAHTVGALITNLRVTGDRDGIVMGEDFGTPATATIRMVEIVDLAGVGIGLIVRASATIERVSVRDLEPGPPPEAFGQGLIVQLGSKVRVDKAVFANTTPIGVYIDGVGSPSRTEATLNDVIVRDTRKRTSDSKHGAGIVLAGGVDVKVNRALIERSLGTGLVVGSFDDPRPPRVELRDTVVRDTTVAPERVDLDIGSGLQVSRHCQVALERGYFARNQGAGIAIAKIAGYDPSVVTLRKVVAVDTRVRPGRYLLGAGLIVSQGGEVTLEQGYFEGNRGVGVLVQESKPADSPVVLNASDLFVGATQSAVNGNLGRGLDVQGNALVTIERGQITGNRETGILASAERENTPPVLKLQDLLIGHTYQAECASWSASTPGSCVDDGVANGGGSAIVSMRAEIALERFEVAHSAFCGLQVAREGSISAQHGTVHHNAVGANIRVPEYDLSQIANDTVRYYENESNLHTQELPLPEIQQWPFPSSE